METAARPGSRGDGHPGHAGLVGRLAAGNLAGASGAGVLALALAAVVLKLWRADLRVPFAYIWDANQFAMYIKEILDHGWYYRNANLGAPFGQQLYDYPNVSTDNLQAFVIKLLGYLLPDWATVMNVYFLLTFPLVAIAAYLVFRSLGALPVPSLVCAVLFSLLPYHFERGEHHLFYSGYFAVPLGVYLALSVFAGRPLIARREGGPRLLAYASRRTLATVALCVVVAAASGAVYYALFTVLLVAAGMIAAPLAGRGRRPLLEGAVVIGLIAAVIAANLAPTIAYRLQHGPNTVAGQRSWTESEYQALKLTQLVLPIEHHRLGLLAHISGKYGDFQRSVGTPAGPPQLERPAEWESVHLGIVGTVGFVFLLVVAFAALVGGRVRAALQGVYTDAAAATLVAFLFGTVGGVSVLVAAGITPQFRSWNRISIFIAFLALLAVARLLSAAGGRWATTSGRRLAYGCALLAVLGLGVLDQTSSAYVPPYEQTADSFRSDAAFVRGVERRLPGDASLYQLPYVPFPDGGLTYRLTEYDLVRGYFHSDRLRWSFGAMSGRPEDWQAQLSQQSLALQARAAATAGFHGVYVDRRGYADGARAAERELTSLVGKPALESGDGQLVLFDLRPLRRQLERTRTRGELVQLREATLRPLRLEWPADVELHWRGGRPWRSIGGASQVVVVNPAAVPLRATFEARLATEDGGRSAALVRFADGTAQRVAATSSGTRLGRELELPPGKSAVVFSTDGPALRLDVTITDARFRPFAGTDGSRP